MTQSPLAAIFPQWGLKHHLQAWRIAHKRKRIDPGATFVAPDGQRFTVTGRMFWRYAKRKRPAISLVWQSHCLICGEPYTFNQRYSTNRMVRTCPAHRGKSRPVRRTPLRDIVLGELDALHLAGGSATHESLIAACAGQLARGQGRDTRRQRVIRCLQDLIDSGSLPDGITLTGDSFICN